MSHAFKMPVLFLRDKDAAQNSQILGELLREIELEEMAGFMQSVFVYEVRECLFMAEDFIKATQIGPELCAVSMVDRQNYKDEDGRSSYDYTVKEYKVPLTIDEVLPLLNNEPKPKRKYVKKSNP